MAEAGNKRVRTCVGCSKQQGKYDLLRIVRNPDMTVSFDETGRRPGRGAYVCSVACLKEAFESRKLQRALRATVGQEDIDKIVSEIGEANDDEGIR